MSPERREMVRRVWSEVCHRLHPSLVDGPSDRVDVPVRRGSAFKVQGEPSEEYLRFEIVFGKLLDQSGYQIVCEDVILDKRLVTASWRIEVQRRVAEALGETP